MNLRLSTTPGHILIDSGRKSIHATSVLPKSDWVQVVHTYDGQSERVYVNGRLDVPAATPSTLEILTPVRMQIGERFIGDIDEVRISKVARSADWVKLQYENQKPLQTLVGPLVQPGTAFSVSENKIAVLEGKSATVTAKAGGAQKVYWIINNGGSETIADVDRFHFTVDAGRVTGDQSFTLQFKAVYADGVKTLDIPVSDPGRHSGPGVHLGSTGEVGRPRDDRSRAADLQSESDAGQEGRRTEVRLDRSGHRRDSRRSHPGN